MAVSPIEESRKEIPLAEMPYSVFVQMEYRVMAVDGADAMLQISSDLGQGRSYRRNTEITLSLNAREMQPEPPERR